MGAIASQITGLTIVYTTSYSDADQSKHQSSASLAFVREICRWPVNCPHKGPVTRKMFPFDDAIMKKLHKIRLRRDEIEMRLSWDEIDMKRKYDEMRWDEVRWDEMRWYKMGCDWDGMRLRRDWNRDEMRSRWDRDDNEMRLRWEKNEMILRWQNMRLRLDCI